MAFEDLIRCFLNGLITYNDAIFIVVLGCLLKRKCYTHLCETNHHSNPLPTSCWLLNSKFVRFVVPMGKNNFFLPGNNCGQNERMAWYEEQKEKSRIALWSFFFNQSREWMVPQWRLTNRRSPQNSRHLFRTLLFPVLYAQSKILFFYYFFLFI